MSARRSWWLAACFAAGCAHAPPTAPTTAPNRALLASITSLGRAPAAESARSGLVVTMSACWYSASATTTANDAAPRLDPRQCRIVGERVVADVPDAATRERVERLTIEDVALKLEHPAEDADAN